MHNEGEWTDEKLLEIMRARSSHTLNVQYMELKEAINNMPSWKEDLAKRTLEAMDQVIRERIGL